MVVSNDFIIFGNGNQGFNARKCLNMAREIERKFLVDLEQWALMKPGLKGERIRQGYVFVERNKSLRVRIKGEEAWMTFKAGESALDRTEVETLIQMEEAILMLDHFSQANVDKIRYFYSFKGLRWEIDEFLGANAGLVIAEAELGHVSIHPEKPEWVLDEVTHDARYLNVNLALMPYLSWKKNK